MSPMALIDTVLTFRDRENERDPLKASWYLVSVCQVPVRVVNLMLS